MLIAWYRERDGCNIADCGFTAADFLKGSSQCTRYCCTVTICGVYPLNSSFLTRTSHHHILEGIMGLCDEFLSRSAGDELIIWHLKAKT